MTNSRATSQAMVKLASATPTTSASTVLTFSANLNTQYSEIILYYTLNVSGALILELIYNAITASYYSRGEKFNGSAIAYLTADNIAHWQIASATIFASSTQGATGEVHLSIAESTDNKITGHSMATTAATILTEKMILTNTGTTAEALTSLTLTTSTGTFTGTIEVYGIKK